MIQSLPLPPDQLRRLVVQKLPWAAEGSWTALFGGRTNSAWRIERKDQAAVLKLYRSATQNPFFPNDPAKEALMLRHLEEHRIAPRLLADFKSPLGHCILYQAVPGQPWTSDVGPVAKLVRTLHRIAPPKGLRRLPNGSSEILQQATRILKLCDQTDELEAALPKLSVPPSNAQTLLHGDIVAGNLIQNTRGVFLIDWQCPAVGDPCDDLALFLSPAMQQLYRGAPLNEKEEAEFLGAFDPATNIRLRMLRPAFHYRMAAYCLWQSQNDHPDYDEGYRAELAALKSL